MSTGLAASTVTPGHTEPALSFPTPVIDAWANAAAGNRASHSRASAPVLNARISDLLGLVPAPPLTSRILPLLVHLCNRNFPGSFRRNAPGVGGRRGNRYCVAVHAHEAVAWEHLRHGLEKLSNE